MAIGKGPILIKLGNPDVIAITCIGTKFVLNGRNCEYLYSKNLPSMVEEAYFKFEDGETFIITHVPFKGDFYQSPEHQQIKHHRVYGWALWKS